MLSTASYIILFPPNLFHNVDMSTNVKSSMFTITVQYIHVHVFDCHIKHVFITSIKYQMNTRLDLMFMKHYAPNRCLYIKVAKLRTGVGFAETSHLQKFEAHSCNSFQDIMITNFQSPNLQREIIQ